MQISIIAGISAATTAQASNQLFEGSWIVKAFGNERTGITGLSEYYSIFEIPQGVQCNPHQPRCNFSETPTDGAGNFAPLGGSQAAALFRAPFTGPRTAKGATLRTCGLKRRRIAPIYRNPALFILGGAPNTTSCGPTSTDEYGGKGPVQLGHPITGSESVTATRTVRGAMGGFNFPTASSGSGPGLRETGVVGEFNVLYPYVYSYA